MGDYGGFTSYGMFESGEGEEQQTEDNGFGMLMVAHTLL
jgi:hypothetical protein